MFTAEAVEKMMQITSKPVIMNRRWKTSPELAPNCPRCASSNTKFCYYNNYSLSQPRYFCKGCRRYWTRGGSLRNVPVGGGCRKNRRSKPTTRIPPPTDRVSGTGNPTVIPSSTTDTNTNVDLAVVFAKFFNQSQNSPFTLTTSSTSSDLLQFPEGQIEAEQQKQGIGMIGFDDLVVTQDDRFIGDYGFMEFPDPNGYQLQPMLNDEFSQVTDLWSESIAPANFSWQTSEIQGLESVVYPNVLINNEDCSSSFDLSGYGFSSSRSL